MRPRRVLFDDLNLIEPILEAVKAAGYERPTPIQEQAIPPALAGRDLLGCAQTGTGKTAAFVLPILQRLDAVAGNDPELRVLVLTPTRELAAQIDESIATYGKQLDLYHTVIFGGVNDKPQIRELRRGVDILVATPGRLLDLMGRGVVSLDRVEFFVLDEADRMLDMGFIHDVRRVIHVLPKRRQTLFFSATIPKEIRTLADSLLSAPVNVAVATEGSTVDLVTQRVYFTDKSSKHKLLGRILRARECKRCLVFSRTKHGANRVVKFLDRDGIRALAIHSNKSQGARTRALASFSTGEVPVLVATDIAARGIDVHDITHVINFDLPNIPETYVHRIGRTARAGASGVAVSFCDYDEREYLEDIERLTKQHIARIENHPYPPSEALPAETNLSARPGARKTTSSPQKQSSAGHSPRSRYRTRRYR